MLFYYPPQKALTPEKLKLSIKVRRISIGKRTSPVVCDKVGVYLLIIDLDDGLCAVDVRLACDVDRCKRCHYDRDAGNKPETFANGSPVVNQLKAFALRRGVITGIASRCRNRRIGRPFKLDRFRRSRCNDVSRFLHTDRLLRLEPRYSSRHQEGNPVLERSANAGKNRLRIVL